MTIAKKAWISGRVQGVSFRAATRRQAEQLGITGYARNLADGRVEVLAVGEDAAVLSLVGWLHRGPFLARVDQVEVVDVAVTAAQDFVIG